MSSSRYVRVSVLIPRKKGISEADFHKHWANYHGPLVTEWLKRYGILKYTQFHITPEYRDKGQAIGVAPNFDGMAEFLVDDYDRCAKAYLDPEYMEKIRPDELKFIDVENIVYAVGKELTVIENNEAVPYEDTGY